MRAPPAALLISAPTTRMLPTSMIGSQSFEVLLLDRIVRGKHFVTSVSRSAERGHECGHFPWLLLSQFEGQHDRERQEHGADFHVTM